MRELFAQGVGLGLPRADAVELTQFRDANGGLGHWKKSEVRSRVS